MSQNGNIALTKTYENESMRTESTLKTKRPFTTLFPSYAPISDIPTENIVISGQSFKASEEEEELDSIWNAPTGPDTTISSEKGFISHDLKNCSFPEALLQINNFPDELLNKAADVLALDYPETDQNYKFNRVMGQSTRGYWNDFKKRVEDKEKEYLEYGKNEPMNGARVDLEINSQRVEDENEEDDNVKAENHQQGNFGFFDPFNEQIQEESDYSDEGANPEKITNPQIFEVNEQKESKEK